MFRLPALIVLTEAVAVSVNHAKVEPTSIVTQRSRESTLANNALLVESVFIIIRKPPIINKRITNERCRSVAIAATDGGKSHNEYADDSAEYKSADKSKNVTHNCLISPQMAEVESNEYVKYGRKIKAVT